MFPKEQEEDSCVGEEAPVIFEFESWRRRGRERKRKGAGKRGRAAGQQEQQWGRDE